MLSFNEMKRNREHTSHQKLYQHSINHKSLFFSVCLFSHFVCLHVDGLVHFVITSQQYSD